MESKMAPTNRILATLLLMVMVLLPSISALPRDAELSIDFTYPQHSGNITNINQTGYNISADYYFGNASYMTGIPAPDLSPYWKNDGTATATGDWDLGTQTFKSGSATISGNLKVGTTIDSLYQIDALGETANPTSAVAGSGYNFVGGVGGADLTNGASISGGGFRVTNGAGQSIVYTTNTGIANGGTGGATQISGGAGGSSTKIAGGNAAGGSGGGFNVISGTGGEAIPTATTNGIGGTAGRTLFNGGAPSSGAGGRAITTTTGTNTGGKGAAFAFQTKTGGVASGGAINIAGNSGEALFTIANGAAATSKAGATAKGGNGGEITFKGGNGGGATGAGTTNTGGDGSTITFQAGTGGIASGATTNVNGFNGNIIFKLGATELARFSGTDNNFWLNADNRKSIYGAGQDASIYYDATNLIFNTSVVGSGIAYFSNNVSATGYITRTSVYDKSKGTALDNIKDVKELTYKDSKDKEQINHSAFYGYTKFNTTDFSKPVKEKITEEICNEIEDEKTGELIITCENITKEVTTYPHKKLEEGVDLGKEIDVLRQAVYELKQQNEFLQEQINNLTGKDVKLNEANARQDEALCSIKLFSWCLIK